MLRKQNTDKSKTATQIVAEAPNLVNREDYAKLVDSWFRGNKDNTLEYKGRPSFMLE
ncbi:hypothetical protein ACB092_06G048400 [Castanea dentata]